MRVLDSASQVGVAMVVLLVTVLASLLFLYASATHTRQKVAEDQVRLQRVTDTLELLDLLPESDPVIPKVRSRLSDSLRDLAGSATVRTLGVLGELNQSDLDLLKTSTLPARLDEQFQRFAAGQESAFGKLQAALLVAFVALIAFALVWGREQALRRRRFEELQEGYRLSLSRVEAERRRIALDLHDTLAQELAGAKMLLSRVPEQEREALAASLDKAQHQVRQLAQGLRPPALDLVGLRRAVTDLVQEFAARTGLLVTADLEPGLDKGLAVGADIHLYRILQEALNNVAKHAHATKVTIRGHHEAGWLKFSVRDDGVGRDIVPRTGSLGLRGMRERAELLGGRLSWETAEGVTIVWEVPLEHRDR
ncbi:MAG: sensor histidine kinase [Spirochaetales bacterium]